LGGVETHVWYNTVYTVNKVKVNSLVSLVRIVERARVLIVRDAMEDHEVATPQHGR